ncbi:hypothetical protein HN51_058954 [Arachis hypogaea]
MFGFSICNSKTRVWAKAIEKSFGNNHDPELFYTRIQTCSYLEKASATSGVGQMTIFYCGKVKVYDGGSPDKAQAIMQLAASPVQFAQDDPGAPFGDFVPNYTNTIATATAITVVAAATDDDGGLHTMCEQFLCIN